MKKLLFKVVNKLRWILDQWRWKFQLQYASPDAVQPPLGVSIGIATFMDRYESCLVPLVRKLVFLFPAAEIIVVANGHIRQREQRAYLSEIAAFCGLYPNVRLIAHQQPRGLSAIWNETILSLKNEQVLLLNDDVDVKTDFGRFLRQTPRQRQQLVLFNSSWSHFLISKALFEAVGPFDEGLKEIGGEDDDYAARLAMQSIAICHLSTHSITSKLKIHQKKLVVNSYGRNMHEEANGYSSYNAKYLEAKWMMSDQPFEGAVYVPQRAIKYWKLRNAS
jgi:hypothetical protein